MKAILQASFLVLLIAFASAADSTDIGGHWTVRYVRGVQLKTLGGAEFAFKAEGDQLTGMANVGSGWPGKAPISNGKIEGDRISFTVYGELGSSSGLPKMDFTGTIHGDEISLTMTLYYGEEHHGGGSTELEGKRDSTK
jgi:hypothetical protein